MTLPEGTTIKDFIAILEEIDDERSAREKLIEACRKNRKMYKSLTHGEKNDTRKSRTIN